MKHIVLFIVFISCFLNGISQTMEPELLTWSNDDPGGIRIVEGISKKVILKTDSSLIAAIVGGFSYSVYSVALQQNEKGVMQFINFVLGVNDQGKIFMTTIQDGFERAFKFKVHFLQKFRLDTGSNFQLLPVEFFLDSIAIMDNNTSKVDYQKATLRISFNTKWKADFNPKSVSQIVFAGVTYLSAPFKINQESYEICIFSHPLTESFYNKENLYWNSDKLKYMVYHKTDQIRDSIIFSGVNLNDLIDPSEKYPLIIGVKKIFISDANSAFTKFKLQIVPDSSKILSKIRRLPNTYKVRDIMTSKYFDVFKFKSSYRLFYFAGSWCKPCTEAIPFVKDYLLKFYGKVDNAIVLVDRSKEIAVQYAKKHNLNNPLFFENLSASSSNYLQSLFSVQEFPSFILVSNGGKIIIKTSSIAEVTAITSKLFL